MANRLVYVMGDIFIFDIDGCIMPNIFPSINETEKNDESLDQEIAKRAPNLSLFPEFIEFYKRNCTKSLAVYFITGRRQKYFEKITKSHLKPLKIYKDYIIKHFPDKQPRILNVYFQWKAKTIKTIMNQWSQDFVRFHIYDDLQELFPIISQEIPTIDNNYKCNLIQEQGDWIYKLNLR